MVDTHKSNESISIIDGVPHVEQSKACLSRKDRITE
jgi:hypothetical protein